MTFKNFVLVNPVNHGYNDDDDDDDNDEDTDNDGDAFAQYLKKKDLSFSKTY